MKNKDINLGEILADIVLRLLDKEENKDNIEEGEKVA